MRRRDFLALTGFTAAVPRVAFAQQARVPRVALVDGGGAPSIDAIRIGGIEGWDHILKLMAEKGYVEGRTIIYDRFRSPAGSSAEMLAADARQVLGARPDVILWSGSTATALASLKIDDTIPGVVFASDLLSQGVVTNLERPAGNLTGVDVVASADFDGKRLSLLAEAVPSAKTVAYANSGQVDQFTPTKLSFVASAAAAAAKLGLNFVPVVYGPGGGEAEWIKVLATARDTKAEMVVFGTDTSLSNGTQQQTILSKLALDARMPTIAPFGPYAQSGGLLGYGASLAQLRPQVVEYIALILTGTKPGDLPVRQPTVFDLVVNLKTAKAIGVTIPPSVLAQATQVVE